MAFQAMWVHGNAVVLRFPGGKGDPFPGSHTRDHQMNGVFDAEGHIEWSDIVGLHRDEGVTFRGRANQRNNFMISIPTPSWRDGVRAKVVMAGFIGKSDTPVLITGIHLLDGRRRLLDIPMPGRGGSGDFPELVSNVNRFDFQGMEIFFGLNITFDVFFSQEGDITFTAVGADFEV